MPARRKAKATANQDGSVKDEELKEVSVESNKVTVRQNKVKESEQKESNPTDATSESVQAAQSEPPAKKKKGRKGKEVVAPEQSADAGKQDEKSIEEPSKKTEISKQDSKAVDESASLSPKKGAKSQTNKNAANEESTKKATAKAQGTKKVNKNKKIPVGETGDRVLRSNSKMKNGFIAASQWKIMAEEQYSHPPK